MVFLNNDYNKTCLRAGLSLLRPRAGADSLDEGAGSWGLDCRFQEFKLMLDPWEAASVSDKTGYRVWGVLKLVSAC